MEFASKPQARFRATSHFGIARKLRTKLSPMPTIAPKDGLWFG